MLFLYILSLSSILPSSLLHFSLLLSFSHFILFLPSFPPHFLPSFLPTSLPSFISSSVPSFLPSFLPSFPPHFLPHFLPYSPSRNTTIITITSSPSSQYHHYRVLAYILISGDTESTSGAASSAGQIQCLLLR